MIEGGVFTNLFKEKKSLAIVALTLIVGISLMLFGDGVGFGGDNNTEARLAKLCESIDGVSGVSVMITKDTGGAVRGVAIVCTGGDDARIRLTLTELTAALFSIPASSVSVAPGK